MVQVNEHTHLAEFEKLYNLYAGAFYKIIIDKVGNDPNISENILMAMFVDAYKHFHEFNPSKSSIFCWLLRKMNDQLRSNCDCHSEARKQGAKLPKKKTS